MHSQRNEDKSNTKLEVYIVACLKRANAYLLEKDYTGAIKKCTQALSQYPHQELYLVRANAYQELAKNINDSNFDFNTKNNQFKTYRDYEKRDYELALKLLNQKASVLRNKNKDNYTWYCIYAIQAKLSALEDDYASALINYTEMIRLSPKRHEIYNARALIYNKLQKFEDSQDDFYLVDKYINEQVEYKEIYMSNLAKHIDIKVCAYEHVFFAEAAREAEMYTMALYYCDEALKICGDDFLAISCRSKIYHKLGEFDQFVSNAYMYYKITSKFERLYSNLEESFVDGSSDDDIKYLLTQAMAVFERKHLSLVNKNKDKILQLIQPKPSRLGEGLGPLGNNTSAILNRIRELAATHSDDQMILCLDQAIRGNPEQAMFYAIRSEIYIRLGKYLESRLDVSIALWLEIDNLEMIALHHYCRAIVSLEQGLIFNALHDYKNILYVLNDSPNKNKIIEYTNLFYYSLREKQLSEIEKPKGGISMICSALMKMVLEKKNLIFLFENNHYQEIKDEVTIEENHHIENNSKMTEKNNKTNKKTVFANAYPVRRKKTNPIYAEINNETKPKINTDEMLKVEEEIKNKKIEKERSKKEKKKEKDKEKKEVLRLSRAMSSPKDNSVEMPQESSSSDDNDRLQVHHTSSDSERDSSPKTFIPKEIYINLLDIEKTIFTELNKASTDEYKYETYLVGGSVFDRVRKILLNYPYQPIDDSDFVTEIPVVEAARILREYFRGKKMTKNGYDQGINVHESKHVHNLLCIHLENIKIDIVCGKKLTPTLFEDTSTRDFAPLYAGMDGKVKDPTNFGIIDLIEGRLRTIALTDSSFAADPIRLLRAIYQSTKRNLNIQAPRKLKKLGGLIINKPAGHVNSWIKKLLSHHHAIVNYNKLSQYRIWNALFPSFYTCFEKDKSWLLSEIQKANKKENVSLQYIFATFIMSIAAHRNPESQEITSATIAEIIKESPYFSEAFPASEMYRFANILNAVKTSRDNFYPSPSQNIANLVPATLTNSSCSLFSSTLAPLITNEGLPNQSCLRLHSPFPKEGAS